MPGYGESLRVTGLREFQRKLKALGSSYPKMLRQALNRVVGLVKGAVVPRVPSISGAARGSLRESSTQKAARLSGGGKRAPHYPWLDFGGKRRGRGRGIAERPFYADGRYIYDVYFEKRDSGELADEMQRQLVDVARMAGFEVS